MSSVPQLVAMLDALERSRKAKGAQAGPALDQLIIDAQAPSPLTVEPYTPPQVEAPPPPPPSPGPDISQKSSVEIEPPEDFKSFAGEGKLRPRPSVPKHAKDITENIVERDADGRISRIVTYTIPGEQADGT